MEFVQDNVKLLDGLTAGQTVTVTFDIRGQEYNGRYFNNLQAWRIKTETEDGPKPAADDERSPIPDNAKDTTDYGDAPF